MVSATNGRSDTQFPTSSTLVANGFRLGIEAPENTFEPSPGSTSGANDKVPFADLFGKAQRALMQRLDPRAFVESLGLNAVAGFLFEIRDDLVRTFDKVKDNPLRLLRPIDDLLKFMESDPSRQVREGVQAWRKILSSPDPVKTYFQVLENRPEAKALEAALDHWNEKATPEQRGSATGQVLGRMANQMLIGGLVSKGMQARFPQEYQKVSNALPEGRVDLSRSSWKTVDVPAHPVGTPPTSGVAGPTVRPSLPGGSGGIQARPGGPPAPVVYPVLPGTSALTQPKLPPASNANGSAPTLPSVSAQISTVADRVNATLTARGLPAIPKDQLTGTLTDWLSHKLGGAGTPRQVDRQIRALLQPKPDGTAQQITKDVLAAARQGIGVNQLHAQRAAQASSAPRDIVGDYARLINDGLAAQGRSRVPEGHLTATLNDWLGRKLGGSGTPEQITRELNTLIQPKANGQAQQILQDVVDAAAVGTGVTGLQAMRRQERARTAPRQAAAFDPVRQAQDWAGAANEALIARGEPSVPTDAFAQVLDNWLNKQGIGDMAGREARLTTLFAPKPDGMRQTTLDQMFEAARTGHTSLDSLYASKRNQVQMVDKPRPRDAAPTTTAPDEVDPTRIVPAEVPGSIPQPVIHPKQPTRENPQPVIHPKQPTRRNPQPAVPDVKPITPTPIEVQPIGPRRVPQHVPTVDKPRPRDAAPTTPASEAAPSTSEAAPRTDGQGNGGRTPPPSRTAGATEPADDNRPDKDDWPSFRRSNPEIAGQIIDAVREKTGRIDGKDVRDLARRVADGTPLRDALRDYQNGAGSTPDSSSRPDTGPRNTVPGRRPQRPVSPHKDAPVPDALRPETSVTNPYSNDDPMVARRPGKPPARQRPVDEIVQGAGQSGGLNSPSLSGNPNGPSATRQRPSETVTSRDPRHPLKPGEASRAVGPIPETTPSLPGFGAPLPRTGASDLVDGAVGAVDAASQAAKKIRQSGQYPPELLQNFDVEDGPRAWGVDAGSRFIINELRVGFAGAAIAPNGNLAQGSLYWSNKTPGVIGRNPEGFSQALETGLQKNEWMPFLKFFGEMTGGSGIAGSGFRNPNIVQRFFPFRSQEGFQQKPVDMAKDPAFKIVTDPFGRPYPGRFELNVDQITPDSPQWPRTEDGARVDRDYFGRYLGGKDNAKAFVLKHDLNLSTLIRRVGAAVYGLPERFGGGKIGLEFVQGMGATQANPDAKYVIPAGSVLTTEFVERLNSQFGKIAPRLGILTASARYQDVVGRPHGEADPKVTWMNALPQAPGTQGGQLPEAGGAIQPADTSGLKRLDPRTWKMLHAEGWLPEGITRDDAYFDPVQGILVDAGRAALNAGMEVAKTVFTAIDDHLPDRVSNTLERFGRSARNLADQVPPSGYPVSKRPFEHLRENFDLDNPIDAISPLTTELLAKNGADWNDPAAKTLLIVYANSPAIPIGPGVALRGGPMAQFIKEPQGVKDKYYANTPLTLKRKEDGKMLSVSEPSVIASLSERDGQLALDMQAMVSKRNFRDPRGQAFVRTSAQSGVAVPNQMLDVLDPTTRAWDEGMIDALRRFADAHKDAPLPQGAPNRHDATAILRRVEQGQAVTAQDRETVQRFVQAVGENNPRWRSVE